jgi:hypothetical protein
LRSRECARSSILMMTPNPGAPYGYHGSVNGEPRISPPAATGTWPGAEVARAQTDSTQRRGWRAPRRWARHVLDRNG